MTPLLAVFAGHIYNDRMSDAPISRETLKLLDELMLKLIEQQENKVLQMARGIHPGVTAEDIRNPQDFPDLLASSEWNFEDGILTGLKSAHIALRAMVLEKMA